MGIKVLYLSSVIYTIFGLFVLFGIYEPSRFVISFLYLAAALLFFIVTRGDK
ncbi:hypothetical protein [Geosporobacter ferrireducens]|uniref:hypothetical protein n=1 Tax=Geosporobacter ferrireducens TaxID=1424294 RepID=UPI0012EA2ACD|nr:hypothetical protein [Geosporobacter ferrireducens]